jgi:hypothetical protein
MTTTLYEALITAALCSFVVIGCDRLEHTKPGGEQSEAFADNGNARCALVDDQLFCASSRMREPIRQASFSAL